MFLLYFIYKLQCYTWCYIIDQNKKNNLLQSYVKYLSRAWYREG